MRENGFAVGFVAGFLFAMLFCVVFLTYPYETRATDRKCVDGLLQQRTLTDSVAYGRENTQCLHFLLGRDP